MKIKHFIVLLLIFVFSSSCAPAYFGSLFQNKNEISSKDQLRIRKSIKTRDWDLAYKIVNTYPLVQNTFHDIRRIQDTVVRYDRCVKGERAALASCLNSDLRTFKNTPLKTRLGKPVDRFVRRFMLHIKNEIAALREKVFQKRKLELAAIEGERRALRLREVERKRLQSDAIKKATTIKLTKRQIEINWSRQIGENGILDALAASDLPVKRIHFDMRENEDRSFDFSLDIRYPEGSNIAHNAPVVQKSLGIILKNIGKVTRQTKIKSRYLRVTYETERNRLQYKFKTKEARTYWNKLKENGESEAERYLKNASLKALGRHEKDVLAKH